MKEWKVGDTYEYQGYKYHIIAIIEDLGSTLYIVRYFGKHKRWWHYEIARQNEDNGKLYS